MDNDNIRRYEVKSMASENADHGASVFARCFIALAHAQVYVDTLEELANLLGFSCKEVSKKELEILKLVINCKHDNLPEDIRQKSQEVRYLRDKLSNYSF